MNATRTPELATLYAALYLVEERGYADAATARRVALELIEGDSFDGAGRSEERSLFREAEEYGRRLFEKYCPALAGLLCNDGIPKLGTTVSTSVVSTLIGASMAATGVPPAVCELLSAIVLHHGVADFCKRRRAGA